jgi:hypothetical protein
MELPECEAEPAGLIGDGGQGGRRRKARRDPNHALRSLASIQADKPVRDGLHTRRFNELALGVSVKYLYPIANRSPWLRLAGTLFASLKWRSKPSERGCKDPLYWAGNRSLESLPTVAEIGPKSARL